MPTNKKWGVDYNGHYILESGAVAGDALLAELAGKPYFKGIQKRFIWKDFEGATLGSYNWSVLNHATTGWLTKCQNAGKKMRILMMYKSFGGKAVPAYITKPPSDPLYNPIYTDPVGPFHGWYKWGTGGVGVTECAALWIPAVADRFIAFLQAMGTALDGHPALATLDMNETAMGNANPVPMTNAQKLAMAQQMARIIEEVIPYWPKTPIGWFVNFPVTASVNILNHIPPKLFALGGNLAGPDVWWHDTSLENGVINKYFDAWNEGSPIIPRAPSVQNANYQHYNHDEQQPGPGLSPIIRSDISLEKLFNRVTETVENFTTPNITTPNKQPLRANYVAWSAWNNKVGTNTTSPWAQLKALFAANYATGGRYPGSTTPGIDLTIPSKFESTPPADTLTKLTISLTTDSGPLNNDLITNQYAITTSALDAGAARRYRKGVNGQWKMTQDPPDEGVNNTYYVRQFKSGLEPGPESDPLTFRYATVAPARSMATIDDNVVLIAYNSALPLSNETGFKAGAAQFALTRVGGGAVPTITGTFVNSDGRNQRVDLNSNAVAGASYTLTYTPGSGTTRLMDMAGNEAPAFTNIELINITGTGNPTAVSTVTGIPGVGTSGGYTILRNWTVSGQVTGTLGPADQVQVDRKINDTGGWQNIGYVPVVDGTWSIAENENYGNNTKVYYRSKVRRGIGSKVGPLSSEFLVNVLYNSGIQPPSITGGTFLFGTPVVVTGSWVPGDGLTLTVSFRGQSYGVGTGLSIVGNTFSITFNDVPYGTFSVGARVTDPAGSFEVSEEAAQVIIPVPLNSSIAKLALARRTANQGSSGFSARLSWTPSADALLAGYRLYYGTSSGNYSQAFGSGIWLGNVTTFDVNELPAGTYYFAITAVALSGDESAYSNEVTKVIA